MFQGRDFTEDSLNNRDSQDISPLPVSLRWTRFGWVDDAFLGCAPWHTPPPVHDFIVWQPWTGPFSAAGCEHGQVHRAEKRQCHGTGGQVQTELFILYFRRRHPREDSFLCFQCWCTCMSNTYMWVECTWPSLIFLHAWWSEHFFFCFCFGFSERERKRERAHV